MHRPLHALAIVVSAAALGSGAAADTATFNPVADGTLISSTDGAQYAIGASFNFFCGRVGTNGEGTLRRGLLRFDLSSIPAGSTITSVTLRVYMTQSNSASHNHTLHRMTSSWGEGASFAFGGGGTLPEANDATWKYRFWPNQQWNTPGGDFVATASATKSINGVGYWTFATNASLVADVQGWVNAPGTNFGWAMRGNENVLETAKKFESRESADVAKRPLLTVNYTPGTPPVPGDLNNDGKVDGADLGILLASWGQAGAADLNVDGTVNGGDLGLLLGYWTTT